MVWLNGAGGRAAAAPFLLSNDNGLIFIFQNKQRLLIIKNNETDQNHRAKRGDA